MRLSPAVGTALFAVLGPPALAAGLVPWLLTRWELRDRLFPGARWIGIGIVLLGLLVVAESMLQFVRRGQGTPAPWAAPTRFVADGLYRVVRNPMYLGVLALVLGQGLFFGRLPVLIWGACLAAVFHLFVVLYEEPALRRRFGAEYDQYCRRVRRWVPTHPARHGR